MKKILFTLAVILTSLFSDAQDNTFSATIANEKGVYTHAGNSCTTRFTLVASEEKLKALKAQLVPMTYVQFESKKSGKNTYACKLTVTNNASPVMVQRIFQHVGLSHFTFDGSERKTADLAGVLQHLL